jgi:hypothetical protein
MGPEGSCSSKPDTASHLRPDLCAYPAVPYPLPTQFVLTHLRKPVLYSLANISRRGLPNLYLLLSFSPLSEIDLRCRFRDISGRPPVSASSCGLTSIARCHFFGLQLLEAEIFARNPSGFATSSWGRNYIIGMTCSHKPEDNISVLSGAAQNKRQIKIHLQTMASSISLIRPSFSSG